MPAVKHCGGGVMIWAFFQPQDLTVNHELLVDQSTAEPSVRPCIQQLKLGLDWVKEQDNDLNHNHNWLKKEKNQVVAMSCQASDLNLVELLWDLKRAVHE